MAKSNVWVTPKAEKFSKMLIDDLHIIDGVGLASILNLAPVYTNSEAVALWVQEKLTNEYERYSDYGLLRCSLVGSVPAFLQGECW
ncbi:hypothetical protein HGG82_16605 [Marinomonas sp. M1K-6]|jgi:hypothetical protein|uniref:Uncharacterized protein n=2 Tax=Marinomonas TaxID=28253 RepID=A0A847R5B1_9GAMM|nr:MULTISPECIES: hypothetical protein [Marinomonas]NLQ19211.1 hypothetical protein [Marinomonas profundi]RCW91826.1 hypothetical protein DFP77_1596 [Marinomonas foliarum]UDV03983.1 hypothetical protein J8N69_04205 [Marinomonas profundi]|tara:strand:- start:26808 stop:27065 length:258 start_codon:yes stop_codon:yes gene_type:complete